MQRGIQGLTASGTLVGERGVGAPDHDESRPVARCTTSHPLAPRVSSVPELEAASMLRKVIDSEDKRLG